MFMNTSYEIRMTRWLKEDFIVSAKYIGLQVPFGYKYTNKYKIYKDRF